MHCISTKYVLNLFLQSMSITNYSEKYDCSLAIVKELWFWLEMPVVATVSYVFLYVLLCPVYEYVYECPLLRLFFHVSPKTITYTLGGGGNGEEGEYAYRRLRNTNDLIEILINLFFFIFAFFIYYKNDS